MWRKLARLRSNVQNIGKSPRVADESMFGGMNGAEFPILVRDMNRARRWNGLSAVFRIVLAPFSVLSCFSSQPQVNGADGLWVTVKLPIYLLCNGCGLQKQRTCDDFGVIMRGG
uniref:Uncharacterized protein n=1 Tax=Salix viminalis TaxID=40686 RepID=A0A6N2MCR2_SALVM